eukprot:jgi/Bigna1/91663/estExt_fgenesh1_pg.C_1110041
MVDSNISSKIEMFISCRNLINKDTFSKSDPMVSVFIKDGVAFKKFSLIDRTEVIDNNLNPNFKKRFVLDYHFERRQEIILKVFDVDSARLSRQSDHDFLGMARTTLADLISRGKAALPLTDQKGRPMRRGKGSLAIIRCNEIGDSSMRCKLNLKGDGLPKMDLFGRADPYLEIYKKSLHDETWLPVDKTEVCKYTYNPRWKIKDISLADLCNGQRKRPLLFKCFDWDKNSSPDFIGQFETCVQDLEEKSPLCEFKLRKPKDAGKRRPKDRGSISVGIKMYKQHSFLDYVRGGCQINLMIAIDFTASNGDPSNNRSLHYIGSGHANAYQQAIATIGNILVPYDSDNKYPVFGFGARIKRTNSVEHCFALNMNDSNPEISGVQSILNTYRAAFNHVLLSGPTYFSEVVGTAAANASSSQFDSSRQEFDDERQTIDQIVGASTLPLSIIIVGVGNADFSAMEKLDGDEVRLCSSTGQRAYRDIVQFVPYRKFNSPELLAKETLQEVPHQFLSFTKLKNVKPLDTKYDFNASVSELPVLAHQPSAHVLSRMATAYDLKTNKPPLGAAMYHAAAASSATANVLLSVPPPQAAATSVGGGAGWWQSAAAAQPQVVFSAPQSQQQQQPQVAHSSGTAYYAPPTQTTPTTVQQPTAAQLQAQIRAAAQRMDFVTAQKLKEQLDKLTISQQQQQQQGASAPPPSFEAAVYR